MNFMPVLHIALEKLVLLVKTFQLLLGKNVIHFVIYMLKPRMNESQEESCSFEYIDGDFTLPVCFENDENWDDDFFAGLSHTDVCTETEELKDEEDLEIDVDAPPLKVKKLSDAIQCLEDVQSYLNRHGYIGEATSIASAIARLHCSHLAALRQSTLKEYF